MLFLAFMLSTIKYKNSFYYFTHNKIKTATRWKVSKYGVISGPFFPVVGPEVTPYFSRSEHNKVIFI